MGVQSEILSGAANTSSLNPLNSLFPPSTIANFANQSLASIAPNSAAATSPTDYRARLAPLHPADIYGDNVANARGGLMNILNKTRGVIFPYSPTITFSQAVNYSDTQLVHSNMDYPSYTRTPTATLSINGKFTVQNQQEGEYALAVIHFFRTVSKMRFGETDGQAAGLPPPVLVFSAYGPYMYNKLRVLVNSHSWSYDEAMDTVPVAVGALGSVGASVVRLPAMFSIQTELRIVQTPQAMRTKFNFDAFATGALMGGGGGWV